MNRDVKWNPFNSLISENNIINNLKYKRNYNSKPILSLDQIELINQNILESYHTKSKVKIKYYYNGFIYNEEGFISNIDVFNKRIFLNTNIIIYFYQIIELNL